VRPSEVMTSPLLSRRLRYIGQVARAFANEPGESVERVREKLAARQDRRARWPSYEPDDDAEGQVHSCIGAGWPCSTYERFPGLWAELVERLRVVGLQTGRGAYGGWDDGDPGLVRLAWCVTHHLRPDVAIETGVARGMTTAAVLRALAENDSGHLFSIDLPPLAESGLRVQTGAAIRSEDTARWTLLKGSSRSMLPRLIHEVRRVDLFVHDSMHTTRNVRFELEQVWPVLASGGVMLADDVERNQGFQLFTTAHPDCRSFVLRADDHRALFGCVVKP
jgi:hypothetical protein